jgi:predicted negative regulator of RcsB-dependent stress response
MKAKVHVEKTFWQKYAKFFLGLFGGFLVVYCGVQYYFHYLNKQALKASFVYDNMITHMQKQDKGEALSEARILMHQYKRTPYAHLAALLLAKVEIEQNNLEAAVGYLRFAIQGKQNAIQQIAKVRLARVLAEQKHYQEALDLLTPQKPLPDYITLFEETKGDIYLMQQEKDKARLAYQNAIKAAPAGVSVTRLQLKQADLGVGEER